MDSSVRQTCTEMLEQRGYHITDPDLFIGEFGNKKIIVFYNTCAKLNVEKVQEYVSLLQQAGIHHCIINYKNSITPVAKKVIEELVDFKLECFEEKTLRFNITKHSLVPKHIALPKKEADEFKKKYGIKIPVILKTDPVSRFFNFQRGDIIKVIRADGFISYRIVK